MTRGGARPGAGRKPTYGARRVKHLISLPEALSADLKARAKREGKALSDILIEISQGDQANPAETADLKKRISELEAEISESTAKISESATRIAGLESQLLGMRAEPNVDRGDETLREALRFYADEDKWQSGPRGPLMTDRRDWRSAEGGYALGGKVAAQALGKMETGSAQAAEQKPDPPKPARLEVAKKALESATKPITPGAAPREFRPYGKDVQTGKGKKS